MLLSRHLQAIRAKPEGIELEIGWDHRPDIGGHGHDLVLSDGVPDNPDVHACKLGARTWIRPRQSRHPRVRLLRRIRTYSKTTIWRAPEAGSRASAAARARATATVTATPRSRSATMPAKNAVASES